MIDPATVCFYWPPEIDHGAKATLFKRISTKIEALGGKTTREWRDLDTMFTPGLIPIVGCSPQLTELIIRWRAVGRKWIYWDRGYWLRVYATWLPQGRDGGLYRWHVNSFQLQQIRDVPPDRLQAKPPPVEPWKKGGKHIVIARPSKTYCRFHRCENWLNDTVYALSLVTDRQLIIRDKESKRDLRSDIAGAHCLVSHGSIAAVESVILGCPVFVDSSSAASLVGQTDLTLIERPVFPDREQWLRNLAYCQFSESELVDGTLWQTLSA